MKKKEVVRLFNFSDSKLVSITNEKIAFMRRDALQFISFGITEANFMALETAVDNFEDTETDGEVLGTQRSITINKDAKAEELRVALRDLMSRVVLKFNEKTPEYRKFGTATLSRHTNSDLLLTAKRAVRVGTEFLGELTPEGVSTTMLNHIGTLKEELENLMIDQKVKMGERDIQQENRVEAANAIYTTLVSYTKTGCSIWETSDVAKYNDYVIYNTSSGTPDVADPTADN